MENKGKCKESEKIICKVVWDDPKMTGFFCKLVVEEINAGNRPLDSLNGRGYKNLGGEILCCNQKTAYPKQFKNRWHNLKILYNFLKSLWTNTGLGKNPDLGTIVASDEWWEENTKVRNLPFISMFMKMSGETNLFMLLCSLCKDICRGRRRRVILVPQVVWKI
jgi:hypothetical protein